MVFKELVTFRWLYLGRDPSKKNQQISRLKQRMTSHLRPFDIRRFLAALGDPAVLLDPSICSSQLIRRFLGRQLIRRFLRYPWMYIFIFLDWGFPSPSYTLTFAHVLVWPCIFVTSAFEGVCCMYSMVCFDFSLQDFILSCQWPGVLSCCGCVDIKAGIRGCDHEGKKAIVTMMCCLVL